MFSTTGFSIVCQNCYFLLEVEVIYALDFGFWTSTYFLLQISGNPQIRFNVNFALNTITYTNAYQTSSINVLNLYFFVSIVPVYTSLDVALGAKVTAQLNLAGSITTSAILTAPLKRAWSIQGMDWST